MSDISAVHSTQYLELSRKLDLEDTRSLEEGEEAVKSEGAGEMVFHICEPGFAIFEEWQTTGYVTQYSCFIA